MSTPWRTRRNEPELMDAPVRSGSELDGALGHVASVNRWLGGLRSLRSELAPLRREDLRVLDVGTGNADLLSRLLRWAARGGGRWSGVGIDIHANMLAAARARRADAFLPLVQGDALALPFPDRAFDVVLCTLTLHHFDDRQAVRLLREVARVAKRVVLVSDLERTPLAYLFARAFALTWWRSNRITRHDGPLSVLRAFTPAELRELAHRAGLETPRVRRRFPFRLTLTSAGPRPPLAGSINSSGPSHHAIEMSP